jgi:hypothetical protein
MECGGQEGVVRENQKKPSPGAIVLLFASLAILASISRLHGRPAFVAGVGGGLLVVIGIYMIAKK